MSIAARTSSPLGARPVCILNPAAGGAPDPPVFRSLLEDTASTRGLRVCISEAPGDPERLAREAIREGATALVSAGGDGSLHGVVNGLALEASRLPILVLPLGTANDFVRSAGLPVDLHATLAALDELHTRSVDLIRIRLTDRQTGGSITRRAINACTAGLAGQTAIDTSSEDKVRWGQLAYLKSGLERLVGRPESFEARISGIEARNAGEVRDEHRLEGLIRIVSIANGGRAGGGLPVAPGAQVDDRQLDLIVIRDAPVAQILPQLLRLLDESSSPTPESADPDEPAAVVRRPVSSAKVAATRAIAWSFDGEPETSETAEFDVEAGRLSLLVPADPKPGA